MVWIWNLWRRRLEAPETINVDALKVEVTVSRAKRANSPKTALKSRPFRSGRPLRSCMASDLKRQSDLYRSGWNGVRAYPNSWHLWQDLASYHMSSYENGIYRICHDMPLKLLFLIAKKYMETSWFAWPRRHPMHMEMRCPSEGTLWLGEPFHPKGPEGRRGPEGPKGPKIEALMESWRGYTPW